MVSKEQLNELTLRIQDLFQPDKIVLFGSYAYGEPRNDSDVDLLVIMPYSGGGVTQAVRIVQQVKPPFGLDIVVRRPDDLRERLATGDFFLREIMSKGKVLYDAADTRVG